MNMTSCVVVEPFQHEALTLPVVVLFPSIHVFMYAVVITEYTYREVKQRLVVGQLPMIILPKDVVLEEELVHQVHCAVAENFTTSILTFAVIGCIYEATAQNVVRKFIQNVTVVHIILSLLTITIHTNVALEL